MSCRVAVAETSADRGLHLAVPNGMGQDKGLHSIRSHKWWTKRAPSPSLGRNKDPNDSPPDSGNSSPTRDHSVNASKPLTNQRRPTPAPTMAGGAIQMGAQLNNSPSRSPVASRRGPARRREASILRVAHRWNIPVRDARDICEAVEAAQCPVVAEAPDLAPPSRRRRRTESVCRVASRWGFGVEDTRELCDNVENAGSDSESPEVSYGTTYFGNRRPLPSIQRAPRPSEDDRSIVDDMGHITII
eukprot:m.443761 g.443761  ORF g.443761 m.443761 type:complete len:245 (-) comp19006_c0_seq1:160-894(-)